MHSRQTLRIRSSGGETKDHKNAKLWICLPQIDVIEFGFKGRRRQKGGSERELTPTAYERRVSITHRWQYDSVTFSSYTAVGRPAIVNGQRKYCIYLRRRRLGAVSHQILHKQVTDQSITADGSSLKINDGQVTPPVLHSLGLACFRGRYVITSFLMTSRLRHHHVSM